MKNLRNNNKHFLDKQSHKDYKRVTKCHSYTPQDLPEGSKKEQITFLLGQSYKRTLKDITKIIYPNVLEHDPRFQSKYAYVRKVVTEMRGQLVQFHRKGRYRLFWQDRPVTVDWLIDYKKEVLLGNNSPIPEWANIKSFFNILDLPIHKNGRKYIVGPDSPCTFEITRAGYITVYVHDDRGEWEDWLFEELIKHGFPQGLVLHIFQHLKSIHVDEHLTIHGFSWPRHLKGSVVKTPYGWQFKLGDGSHPDSLEIEFKTNIQSDIKCLNRKLDYLLRMAGWIDKKGRVRK